MNFPRTATGISIENNNGEFNKLISRRSLIARRFRPFISRVFLRPIVDGVDDLRSRLWIRKMHSFSVHIPAAISHPKYKLNRFTCF